MNTNTKRFMENPDYVLSIQLLVKLHKLIAEGKGDSAESDVVRDAMEPPAYRLTQEESNRLNILSANLYMLDDKDALRSAPPERRTRAWLEPQLETAHNAGDWDAVLELLRYKQDFLSSDEVACLRGEAYAKLGHSDIAELFFDYAKRRAAVAA